MLESRRTVYYSDLVYFDVSGTTGRSLLDLMFLPFLHKSELIKASSFSAISNMRLVTNIYIMDIILSELHSKILILRKLFVINSI